MLEINKEISKINLEIKAIDADRETLIVIAETCINELKRRDG